MEHQFAQVCTPDAPCSLSLSALSSGLTKKCRVSQHHSTVDYTTEFLLLLLLLLLLLRR